MTLRLLIAVDVRLYREALADALSRLDSVDVVGTAGNRLEIRERVNALEPDVVLLDPGLAESIEAVREIVRNSRGPRVVALASSEAESDVIACAEAGVSGFVSRSDSVIDLVAAIESAARGDLICSPRTAGALLRRVATLAAGPPPDESAAPLTPRELEVIRLIAEGLSNKQIARQLYIELPTVKHHVHHILQKLGVARRSEAVARLRQHENVRRT